MKPAILKRWLKNLRSGKFKQTTLEFHRTDPTNGDVYCPLGLLLETEVVGDWIEEDAATVWRFRSRYGEESWDKIPFSALVDLGVHDEFERAFLVRDVVAWNDEALLSFTQIADKIEQMYSKHCPYLDF